MLLPKEKLLMGAHEPCILEPFHLIFFLHQIHFSLISFIGFRNKHHKYRTLLTIHHYK